MNTEQLYLQPATEIFLLLPMQVLAASEDGYIEELDVEELI